MYDEDDDDETPSALYEDGHWKWDNHNEQLVFESDVKFIPEAGYRSLVPVSTLMKSIEFNDDLDIFEQERFKRKFQNKFSDEDVVRLQDITDLVLYTAPKSILDSAVISVVHLSSTDRFIRALILYNQYYLQIADEMGRRILDLETKIPSKRSHDLELEYRGNLQDLRVLIAKEYCNMISGAGEFNKYHHMGRSRKFKSLIKKECVLFESMLRICIQVVWLALGRKCFNQIEFEMHRMFKSEKFNTVAHKTESINTTRLSPQENSVLMGPCLQHKRMTTTQSPLMNELSCRRKIDYKLLGLGIVKYPVLNSRLRYLEHVLIAPEKSFSNLNISLGIIGLQRNRFDTMLREIKTPVSTSLSTGTSRNSIRRLSRSSQVSGAKRSSSQAIKKPYPEIVLPPHEPNNTCGKQPAVQSTKTDEEKSHHALFNSKDVNLIDCHHWKYKRPPGGLQQHQKAANFQAGT